MPSVQVRVKPQTWTALKLIGKYGDSMDDIISMLIKEYRKNHPEPIWQPYENVYDRDLD